MEDFLCKQDVIRNLGRMVRETRTMAAKISCISEPKSETGGSYRRHCQEPVAQNFIY